MSSSLDKKRSVSFDEELNEVREFDRVPPEDKANVWVSKVQFRENRIQVAEELMMERTRELVKAKLIEETILSTNQAELVIVVKKMQQDLDDIMSRPKPEILAFLQNKYNWITDCTDYWHNLPDHIQQAASQLGYTQELWDEFSQKLDVFAKPWNALTSQEQAAAKVLGYNEVTWNGSLEVNEAVATAMIRDDDDDDDDEPKSAVVEMEEGEDSAADPMYDWGESNDDSSPSDYDGDEEKMSESDDSREDEKILVSPDSDDEEKTGPSASGTATLKEIASRKEDKPSKGSYVQANVIEPMDDDEDEFIANFLLDHSEQTTESTTKRRSSLHDRYVPSDDEFDLEIGDGPPTKEKNVTLPDKKVVSSANPATSVLLQDNMQEERIEETSPLLGHKKTLDPTTAGAGGGLFRRMLGSSPSSQNSDRSCSSVLKQRKEGSDGDGDDDTGIERSRNHPPFLSKKLKRILIFLIILALLWLLTNSSVLIHWRETK